MCTDDAQTEGEPIIEVDLGDNGGGIAFHTLEEAERWINREIKVWDNYGFQGIRSPVIPYILEQQLQLPRAISESIKKATEAQGDERLVALDFVKDQFEQYADYRSLCSESQIGNKILTMIEYKQPFLAIGALASNLGIPANDLVCKWHAKESELGVILSGYALCHASNTVRRSDLADHNRRMEVQLKNLDDIVRRATDIQDELKGSVASTVEESSQDLRKEQTDWANFSDTAQIQWETLRKTFESQLRLEAPVTYWRERADITSKAANWWLFAFSVIAIAVIGVLIVFGPEFLGRVSAMKNAGPFTTLALVSFPTLTALWGLKHIARLFVTNIERSADARLRETMTTTFLALTKEGEATVNRDERLLILEALFRPPAPAPSDDGHWSSLSALLPRRSS